MGALAVGLDGGREVCFEISKESANVLRALLWEWSVGEFAVGIDRAEVDGAVVSFWVVEVEGAVLGEGEEIGVGFWSVWPVWPCWATRM